MSDQKRAPLTTIGTANSEKKSDLVLRKTVRLSVTLSEPNEDSCPVLDYTKLCRSEEKKKLHKKHKDKPNGTLLQFDEDEDDVRRIARQFEEKYGNGEKQRQSRCQTYSELGAGYDETDSFIDNTEAYDEALPEELQTLCGGYYINSGRLEFKRVEVSDHSDIDEIIARRRKKKLSMLVDEEEEDEAEDDNEDETSEKLVEEQKKDEVLPTVPRKVKISEDKPSEPTLSNDKDKNPVTKTSDPEAEHVKAKKRKLQMQSMTEDTPAMKQKKKALTVKALLEEKRVYAEPSTTGTEEHKKSVATPIIDNHTSINDVIESVVKWKEDSNSSSVLSKSHSGSAHSSDSEDSNEAKPNNMLPGNPLPDAVPAEVVEIVFRIKHLAATTSDLPRKLTEDINNSLVNFEWKTRDLPSALRHSLYAHLSNYLPCSKETLMRRTKKLVIQREEEKMKEPIKKLKSVVDAMMPVLLDKYNKECQRLAEEQGVDIASNNTPSSKVARRKFPWNDELRGYLRELITVQLQCFNILKLRKETSEAFVTKFLNTHVRILWPPGWMKTSTLLREGRGSSPVLKHKKHSSNGMEPSNKNVNNNSRLNLSSLPSSTTVTPSSGSALPTYSRSESNNYQHKLPTSTSMITTTPLGTKTSMMESTNLLSKMTSLSSSISPPKKSHSPGSSITISPVKKEPFTVDALLKKNIETGYNSEPSEVKKDGVSVITVNGSQMPFKDLPLAKIKKEECNSNSNSSGDKILDLSNCMSKQHHNIPLNNRTAVTNGESVNLNSAEDIKPVNNSGLPPSKPKEAMASFLMSRKQRILHDSLSDDIFKSNIALVNEPARHNESTANNVDLRRHRKPESKKKHKSDQDKEILIPSSASNCMKSPPPYISTQEAERRLNEETATATDILSQIINESLLGTPSTLQHQRSYEEEIPEGKKIKQRTMSADQDAKVNQEVDQVIQDLVELRQMSGGSTDTIIENSKNNYNSNPLGLHHGRSHDSEETTKLSPYSGFQDEFFKHLLKKETNLPTINKPTPLPKHSISPFDNNLPFTEDIPSKPSLYNSLPHRTNQSMSQHNILPPTSKPAQMNHHGNVNQVNHGNPNAMSLQTAGHPHRPVYFPQLGFSNDDQHLLGLTNNLQFGWPFPGSSESSPPH